MPVYSFDGYIWHLSFWTLIDRLRRERYGFQQPNSRLLIRSNLVVRLCYTPPCYTFYTSNNCVVRIIVLT
jgi:hypothetical protein